MNNVPRPTVYGCVDGLGLSWYCRHWECRTLSGYSQASDWCNDVFCAPSTDTEMMSRSIVGTAIWCSTCPCRCAMATICGGTVGLLCDAYYLLTASMVQCCCRSEQDCGKWCGDYGINLHQQVTAEWTNVTNPPVHGVPCCWVVSQDDRFLSSPPDMSSFPSQSLKINGCADFWHAICCLNKLRTAAGGRTVNRCYHCCDRKFVPVLASVATATATATATYKPATIVPLR
jgi:hypothetical protein